MIKKPTIIDGVDVSGCGYFDDNECMIAGLGINDAILYCHCKSNPNCHYKLYKRKEQECEKWQAEFAYKNSELRYIEEKIKPLMKRPDDLDCYDLEWIVCAFVDEFNQLKAKEKECAELKDKIEFMED